jgi:hypothetical protein
MVCGRYVCGRQLRLLGLLRPTILRQLRLLGLLPYFYANYAY